jgi:hypothetical protein
MGLSDPQTLIQISPQQHARQSNAPLILQAAAVAEVTRYPNFKIHSAISGIRIRAAQTPLPSDETF